MALGHAVATHQFAVVSKGFDPAIQTPLGGLFRKDTVSLLEYLGVDIRRLDHSQRARKPD